MQAQQYNPATLRERLENQAAANQDDLFLEAAQRIRELERLCAMMTDTGVVLEEDAAELAKADFWWVPGDGEVCYTSLDEAHADLDLDPLVAYNWERSHRLPVAFSVKFPELRDGAGRLVSRACVREFYSEQEAEEAVVVHTLRARRNEVA